MQNEREAIVEWLRGQATLCFALKRKMSSYNAEWISPNEQEETFEVAADAIERGEHLKEGERT